MSSPKSPLTIAVLFLIAFCLMILPVGDVESATMTDYCMTPPFIVGGITPNLLLILDNSASMYDLQYVDNGTSTRKGAYCYDQTYASATPYAGYFDSATDYEYDLTGEYFYEINTGVPTCASSSCKGIADQLFINMSSGPPRTLSQFVAKGNYLNWLTSSKFDVQKQILTGGKYDPVNHILLPETRGCIGRKFVKEALTADYVEGGTNTSLGITMGVEGERHPENPAAPSPGGQTYLKLYFGDYNQGLCQAAINAYQDPAASNADIKKAVDDCLSSTTLGSAYCAQNVSKTCTKNSDCILGGTGTCTSMGGGVKKCTAGDPEKVAAGTSCVNNADCDNDEGPCITTTATTASKTQATFNQTIQACWALKTGTPLGIDEKNTVINQCTDIYDELFTCDGGTNDGRLCTGAADCPSGSCINGPAAVRPGNPAYLCSSAYTGICYVGASPGGTWTGCIGTDCGDACILKQHEKFCGDITVPPVTDPTDLPSDTSEFDNLPAIISDMGIEGQLGQPFETLTVRIKDLSASPEQPVNLVQQFSGLIRMGVMSFNFNGSVTECGRKVCSNDFLTTCTSDASCTGGGLCITPVPCPKTCSSDANMTCSTKLDCPNPESAFTSCDATTVGTSNFDGAQVLSYISPLTGDHNSGLVRAIDDLKGTNWTPFAEAYYNAIGYYARTDAYGDPSVPGTSRTDLRINGDHDFASNNNPSQYRCQDNNILLISDGQPTADKRPAVNSLVALYNDGDGQTGQTATCPPYEGSRNLDDLAWLAKHRNIKTFDTVTASTAIPANASEQITTYVVYTGPDTGLTNECNPKTLMNNTAVNGGTTLYDPKSPGQLKIALREALTKISAKTASGTAASVLASGEGSGANLIQALFYPKRKFVTVDVTWTGVLQNMWYYLDPNLGFSSIREDTDNDRVLKLGSDYIIDFTFSKVTNETTANLFADADGNGSRDSVTPTTANVPMDSVQYLWEAGRKLHARAASDRVIYTNTDDNATLDNFITTNAAISPFLNVTATANLIQYIRGVDDLNGDNVVNDSDAIDGAAIRSRTVTVSGSTNTWKLGDIVNSTPKISSWIPLNLYDKSYRDTTYRNYLNSTGYTNRGTVFSGANDGMLHAFKLGKLGLYRDPNAKASLGKACSVTTTKACRDNADCPTGESCLTDADMGKEIWAFIPKHALPYLKYLADRDYCHLYYIDATPYLFDASIAIDPDLNDDGTADQPDSNCNSTAYSDYWKCRKSKDSWRTVLIGSMRLGGACEDLSSTCTECMKTPISNYGYSSYFAMDVTDPASPTLLWEYADPELGLSTTGPGIVRINNKYCSTTTTTACTTDSDCPAGETCLKDTFSNGRWYVVLGSGPTGYVSPTTHQFTGTKQHLSRSSAMLVVLDLKTGTPLRTIDAGGTAAFVGNLMNSSIDFDMNYSDDALYFGYTERAPLGATVTAQGGSANTITLAAAASSTNDFYKGNFVHRNDLNHETKLIIAYDGATKVATIDSPWKDAAPTSSTQYNILDGWNAGGVKRLLTKQSLDPSQWAVSTVISNIGPVTSGVGKLQNLKKKELRLFFGAGRYFYKINDLIDDPTAQRRLYGIKEPCFPLTGSNPANIDTTCTASVSSGILGDAATAAGSTDPDGWYINLDQCVDLSGATISCSDPTAVFRSERIVTDPLATLNGAVFFTSSSPTADVCEYGGASHIWAVRYDTGGTLVGSGTLRGTAIVQVSTGAIEEVDLATAFTEKDQRRSGMIQGLPPAGALSLVVPPKPINKILHMKKQ